MYLLHLHHLHIAVAEGAVPAKVRGGVGQGHSGAGATGGVGRAAVAVSQRALLAAVGGRCGWAGVRGGGVVGN